MAFDTKTFVVTTVASIFVAVGSHFAVKWLDTPSGLSADVFAVPNYGLIQPVADADGILLNDFNALIAKLPPTSQLEQPLRQRIIDRASAYDKASLLSRAPCANIVRITNHTTKVVKDITVTAEHIAGFLAPTGERRPSMKPSLDKRLNLSSIDPGDSTTLVAYTSYNCDNDYGGFSKVRVFTNETTAHIRTVLMPRGFMITLNHYWETTYFLIVMGIFLFAASIINGIVEAVKKESRATAKTEQPDTDAGRVEPRKEPKPQQMPEIIGREAV